MHGSHNRPPGFRINRRTFLRYVGAGVTGLAASRLLGPLARAAAEDGEAVAGAWTNGNGTPAWVPVAYPIPIPGDRGSAETDPARLAKFEVRDELLLPDGFRYDVVARWGDVFGPKDRPDKQVKFGFASDYTGLVPVRGKTDEFWLIVNHEYISGRPWLQGCKEVHGAACVDALGRAGGLPLHGLSIDLRDPTLSDTFDGPLAAIRKLCTTAMDDLGVSVLRVRRADDGRFSVIADADDHLRISGNPRQGKPTGGMSFTGPAAVLLKEPTGTFSNCSGAVTPWGTFLTCEENFQDQVPEFIDPAGRPLPGDVKRFGGLGEDHPTRLPFEFEGLGTGTEPPLDGRQFGWVCEVDPVGRSLRKHTALGRFRHENVALRVEKGKRLAAYMGDDRRGGHVWKFVSDGVVNDPKDASNTDLLTTGTLYAARLRADFSGEWVPVRPGTPLARPEPQHLATGHLMLPRRPEGGHAAVGTPNPAEPRLAVEQWVKSVEEFAGKTFGEMTLADLCDKPAIASRQSAVLVTDAYVMANAAGATPCSRPEDIEIHPHDKSVYIAFTDSTGGPEGSPDVRIFPDSAGKNSRQYGAIYRIAEDGDDPAATTFKWGKFVASGEAADGGGGFACADNLVFDPDANLWMVCDITTPAHNFPVTRTKEDKTSPGDKNFMGVFGNNALFMIPTAGPHAGMPHCFGIGPMECELTGPTFTPDGRTLLLAVQHPGELHGTRGLAGAKQPTEVTRPMQLAARDGKVFSQQRTIPLGSNFPSGKAGDVPRPCVVCVTRKG